MARSRGDGAGPDGTLVAEPVDDRHGGDRWEAPATARWPWLGWAAAGVLVFVVGALVALASRANGEFTYPLDDPYIHLRLAQNLSRNFVLGVNPGEFASAGSSLLWPPLLAVGVKVFGARVGLPLVLSTFFGVVTLVLVDRWAVRRGVRLGLRVAFLGAMLFVVPLVLMSVIGMEHVLQILLAFFLVDLAVSTLLDDETTNTRLAGLAGLALALAAVRLEALFVVVVLGLLLLVRRRIRAAVALGVGAAVPVVVMVAVNTGQGWPALPASVLAKSVSGHSGIDRFLPHPQTRTLLTTQRLVVAVSILVVVLVLGHRLGDRFDGRARWWGIAALGIFVVHLCFGMFGWLYRYEAYLIALCLGALALGAESLLRHRGDLALSRLWRVALGVAVAVLLLLGVADGLRIHQKLWVGMREVRQQQREMARFTATACPGCRVVLNDIGIVSFYGDVEVTDAAGLANRQVVEQRVDGTFDTASLERIARDEGAQMAMVYPVEPWVPGIPSSWIKIGEWTYPANEVVGGKVVAVYAIDRAAAPRLRQAFADFDSHGFFEATPA
jgi:hypothetical protein